MQGCGDRERAKVEQYWHCAEQGTEDSSYTVQDFMIAVIAYQPDGSGC